MPPRYVYWTIIVDGQPTAFRSGSLEDIMPTFNRLKEKQPTAELKWFQNGQLWPSRHDAQDFMRARGERGRAKDPRQADAGGEKRWDAKPAWKTRSTFSPKGDRAPGSGTRAPRSDDRPTWVPKGEARPAKQSSSWDEEPESPIHDEKPSFAKASEAKPEWKPKGSFTPAPRKSFGDRDERPSFAKASADRPGGQARSDRKPEWKPKGTFKPKEAGHSDGWGEKPGFKGKADRAERPSFAKDGDKPAWKPKSASSRSFGDKPFFAKSSEGRPAWKSKGDKPWKPKGSTGGKSEWKPKSDAGGKPSYAKASDGKPEWKPKGTFTPKEDGHRPSARDQARSSFRPKSYTPKEDDGRTRASRAQSKNDKLDWKPASAKASARQGPVERRSDGPNSGFAKSDPDAPKRKWVPKEEYKKSMGIEVKRDDKWRPGGVHRDPKQKYKDAKKAKWGRFKEAIRSRSAKPKKRDE